MFWLPYSWTPLQRPPWTYLGGRRKWPLYRSSSGVPWVRNVWIFLKRSLNFPSKHPMVVSRSRVTLACDHTLSLYLCNLFSGDKEAGKQKNKKAWSLAWLRSERLRYWVARRPGKPGESLNSYPVFLSFFPGDMDHTKLCCGINLFQPSDHGFADWFIQKERDIHRISSVPSS